MRFTANTFLISVFVSLFSLAVVAVTIHFQFLNSSFWERSFTKNNLYPNLAAYLKNNTENQIVKEGGKKSDAQVLTNLITPANVKDLLDKNISNFISYANGKVGDFFVYVPIGKIPKSLIPKELTGIPEQITLAQLFSKLNVKNVSLAQIKYISIIGKSVNYFLILDLSLLLLTFILLIVLVQKGKRLIAPGIALILAGIGELLILLLEGVPFSNPELGGMIMPILKDTLVVTKWSGIGAIFLGIILIFIKKGSINNHGPVSSLRNSSGQP